MDFHIIANVVIVIVVVIVVAYQYRIYRNLVELYNELEGILPSDMNAEDWKTFVSSNYGKDVVMKIDDYLYANRGVAPNFDIVKDIVVRKVDELDERVRSMQPIPLYLGLVGTILGIVIGLCALALEDNSNLFGSISTLLLGVAFAMGGSLSGVLFTVASALRYKNITQVVERGKSDFFHWFQINLLPVLGKDPSGPIGQLIQSLANFNDEFGKSAGTMSETAQSMANTFATQKDLLDATQKLLDSNLAYRNVEMAQQMVRHIDVVASFNDAITGMQGYVDKLRLVTRELQGSTEYLHVVQNLVTLLNGEREAIKSAMGGLSQHITMIHSKQQQVIDKSLSAIEQQNQLVLSNFRQHLDSTAIQLGEYLASNPALPGALVELSSLPKILVELNENVKYLGQQIEQERDKQRALISKPTNKNEVKRPLVETPLKQTKQNPSGSISAVERIEPTDTSNNSELQEQGLNAEGVISTEGLDAHNEQSLFGRLWSRVARWLVMSNERSHE